LKQYNNLHSSQLIPGQILFLKNPGSSSPTLGHIQDLRKNVTNRSRAVTINPHNEDNNVKGLRSRFNSLVIPKREKIRSTLSPISVKPDEVIKESGRYCSDSFHVSGVLTLTPDFFIFEPDMNDPFVNKNGILPYQLYLNMGDIFDCQIIRENEKYYYDTSLEISVFKDDSVKMYDFILDEKKIKVMS